MIELGTNFAVMGDWDTSAEPEGKIVIRMPVAPHHTYGCWHQTTRMCIEALEERVKPGMSVLDFGTGSGILAMVAHLLGAEKVYATELEPEQVKFAQRVWDLNNVPVVLADSSPRYHTLEERESGVLFVEALEVDLCVANIGDQLWDIRHQIKAETLINVSSKGELVVVNA